MRHGNAHRKFNRKSAHIQAMLQSLSCALIKHEQITTTLPKAKELRPYIEKIVTLAKKGGLNNRRAALALLQDEKLTDKLFDALAKRYADRPGGYTRVMKAGFRHGDMAPVGIIEFVDRDINAKGQDSGPKQETAKDDEPHNYGQTAA